MAFVLGIANPKPLGGVMSNNPGFNNSQQAAKSPQAVPAVPVIQGSQQPAPNQGIPVIEVPWHKATPAMKNIK
tara:strand:+ start:4063 stop:4281 length:219 start_codon:yes stop_codon:yes gene_type:complete